MIEAIIGAAVGAVLGGLVTYLVTVQSLKLQFQQTLKQREWEMAQAQREEEQARLEKQREHQWDVIVPEIPFLAELLSSDTAEQAKQDPQYARRLYNEFERHYKRLFMSNSALTPAAGSRIRQYLQLLHQYCQGQITEDELRQARIDTRNAIASQTREFGYDLPSLKDADHAVEARHVSQQTPRSPDPK